MTYDALFRLPQWMMWGVDNEDGTVTLIASKNLKDFTLSLSYDPEALLVMDGVTMLEFMRPIVEAHGKVVKFTIVTAATYGEAFNELFEKWADNDASNS